MEKVKVWIIFLLGSSFTLFIFLSICKWKLNQNFFLNTVIIIFCLICSLNILHSNENSCFSVEGSVSISSKFTFPRHFPYRSSDRSYTKIILTFFFAWFYLCHGRWKDKVRSLLFPSSQSKFNWVSQVY